MTGSLIHLENCGKAPSSDESRAVGDAIARVFEVAGGQRIPEAAIVEAMRTMAVALTAGEVRIQDNVFRNHTGENS